jgi:hypothetical protein
LKTEKRDLVARDAVDGSPKLPRIGTGQADIVLTWQTLAVLAFLPIPDSPGIICESWHGHGSPWRFWGEGFS